MQFEPARSTDRSPAGDGAEPRSGERREPGRGAATDPAGRAAHPGAAPDPEVRTKRGRRTFTAEYKARVLREADAAQGPGEVGALLRREGLYSSHLALWRRQRAEAQRGTLAPRKRGPKGKSAEAKRVAELERQNARLAEELRKARIIIEYQKKVHALLGIPLPDVPDAGEP